MQLCTIIEKWCFHALFHPQNTRSNSSKSISSEIQRTCVCFVFSAAVDHIHQPKFIHHRFCSLCRMLVDLIGGKKFSDTEPRLAFSSERECEGVRENARE